MARIAQGIQISTDSGTTWYKLSDHNRQPINISYEIIESSQRMANGLMRKYVVAKKLKVSADWQNFPSLDTNLVDYATNVKGGAWIKAFYESNLFQPIQVKLIFANEAIPATSTIPVDATYTDAYNSQSQIFNAYITSFTYDIDKRIRASQSGAGIDYVSIKMEFTEI